MRRVKRLKRFLCRNSSLFLARKAFQLSFDKTIKSFLSTYLFTSGQTVVMTALVAALSVIPFISSKYCFM